MSYNIKKTVVHNENYSSMLWRIRMELSEENPIDMFIGKVRVRRL